MARFVVALSLSLFAASLALAQNPPASDPQALSFVAQSIVAMTQGAAIADVTITGNATWIAGSDHETGQLTLRAKGVAESRIDLYLSGGTRSEIRNDTAGFPQGATVGLDGTLDQRRSTIAGSVLVGFFRHCLFSMQLPIPL